MTQHLNNEPDTPSSRKALADALERTTRTGVDDTAAPASARCPGCDGSGYVYEGDGEPGYCPNGCEGYGATFTLSGEEPTGPSAQAQADADFDYGRSGR